jgi:DNA-binding Lrp family transcriptional regulator
MNNILYNRVMEAEDSDQSMPAEGRQNPVRPTGTGELDDIDQIIVRELARDARIPNNALADRVGVAPSTCLGRVRSLRERGVIRGYHADVDPAALGRPLQAMIAVRLQSHARGRIREFVAEVAGLPEVLNVFFLAGKDDFLLHVAAASTSGLRDLVELLSSNAAVAYTETSLIFEHVRADVTGEFFGRDQTTGRFPVRASGDARPGAG